MTQQLSSVAVRAVERAGDYLADRFHSGRLDAEFTDADVKTAADREAEQRVLETIRESFPDHPIATEESGEHPGDGDYRWVVDPLDGTNNFSAGIPTFGSSVTACGEDGPVATAVSVPVLDDVYVAGRGEGVRYNDQHVDITRGATLAPEQATVGCLIGPPVVSGGRERREWDAIADAIDAVPKRTIHTWAPVVYFGLLARGKLDGFVCYYPPEREQVAGELLAREAGCVGRSDGPLSVFATTEELRDALWTAATDAA
jgi:myo-inositol-1(or 4)-monophosphatase